MPTLTIDGDYANYTAQQCFNPNFTFSQQVDCHSQHLNVTHPPSTWSYDEYPFLWEPTVCLLTNVTYSQRINVPDNFNWCFVPLSGSDAFLFVSLALIACGCLFGKLSAVWVLITGGVVGAINNWANLRHISNSITLWLGISPPDLFFYAFLPPLLVDSAIRIDFFMFSKLWVHCVLMAFVMVVLSALILTPLILYVLGFANRGFTWVHGALFAAMISSTDALAATAILKQGGGPEKLVVLMEGEALLNDASAITLFEVFLHLLADYSPTTGVPSVWGSIPVIIEDTLKLAGIGAGVGLAMSIATGYLLRWLRWRGAKPAVEITIILAVAYLSFYVGQNPAKGSGVISVVVFGLWGNFTSKWGMLSTAEESGSFDAFWDTLSFASNGLVFFWAGIASINYLIRSIDILGGQAWSYAAIPFIFIFMMLIRTGCLALFNLTAFTWIKERLSWAEVVFTGWAGLRGAISLILNADFIAHSAFLQGDKSNPDDPYRQLDQVNSDIAIWTSAFVLLTLVVNAPSVSTIMHWLRLDRISREKQAMRAKAKRALLRFTSAAIGTLRDDEEEFLQGANWEAVAAYVDMSQALKQFDPPAEPEAGKGGAEGLTTRKSLPHMLLTPLRAPVDLALSPFMHSKEAAASPATVGREPSARGRSSGGGLAAIGGMLRSMSRGNLGEADRSTRSRMARRSSRSSHRGRSRSRSRRGRTPSRRFSDTDSGGESDFEESDTESSSSLDSRWSGPSSAGPMLGEVVEECPFLQRPAQRRNSTEDEVPAAAPDAQVDIEMGLRPPLQQQQQQAAAPPAAPSADGTPSGARATVSAGQAAAIAAMAASSPAQVPAAEEPALAAAAPPAPQAQQQAPPSPAPAAEEEEEMTAEELQFMRKVQERQRAQQQRRPTLGGLFSPPSDTETPSPRALASGSGASPFGLAAAGGAAGLMVSSSLRDSRRQGSTGALQTVTEHQQLVTGRDPDRWHQQLEEPGSSAAGSDREGSDLYYSSMPAAVGRQLQVQLRRELQGGDTASASPSTSAAAAAGAGGTPTADGHTRSSSGEELYYSSLPAVAGRQLQAQLQQHLMVTPPQRTAGGSQEAGGPASASPPAASSPDDDSPGASPVTEQSPEAPRASYYSSVPAALGRQMAEQLAAERAGHNLQAELQRQLAAQRDSTTAASRAAAAAAVQAGRLSGMPQRDLLGRRIDRSSRHAASSAAGSSSGDMPSLPLSARGAQQEPTPLGAAAASVLPAATPLSAHLQLRRARTLHDRAVRGTPGAAADLAGAGSLSARQPPRSREEVVALLARGSAPRASAAVDTSWQHKPMRLDRRTSHHHRHPSSGIAAASETASQPTSPDYMAATAAMTPATLLARTYSGPTVVAAITAASTGRKMQQRAALLQRISADGISRESSQHDGSDAAAALAAGLFGDAEDKPVLEAVSPFARISGAPLRSAGSGMSEGVLTEMRSRLIAGLKRYFHGKRMEGLLSVQGLRILEYACDHAAEHTNTPLGMWELLEKEVKGKIGTRVTARCLLLLARSWRSAPRWLQNATNWPVTRVTGFLRRMLGRAMLVSCEVAVEYYLALIHSPQIQWLQQTEHAWPLQVEVDAEVDAAYRFIIDREIEAPDRFQAIQSYRAAMAVLRQQLTFVHELYESGMVDEGEKEDMLAPLDKRLRHLEITGPVWKPPRPRAVLRGLPFMQSLPDELFAAVRQAGTIKEYKTGETFWCASEAVHASGGLEGPGMYVVLSGVIRRVHHRPDGTKKEYFQGIGGVVGALLAWTGTCLPGGDSAVTEGNTLGKGPMLFHLPQSTVASLQAQHTAGDGGATQLRLHLLRLAGAYVVESCENDVVEAMQLHLVQLATAKLQRSLRKRGGKHGSGLFSSTERPSSGGGGTSGPGRQSLARESGLSEKQEELEAQAGQPAQPLRPSATQSRLQRGRAAEEEAEAVAAGRMTAKQQLQAQAAPTASGLRASKSIGAHMAELMQQIAQEEFEELGGDAAAGQQRLTQVEEGEEEPEGASPHASSYVAGDSTADLAGLGDGAAGAEQPPGGHGLPNGAAQHPPRSPRASHQDYLSHGPSSSAEHGRHVRTAKLPRHRVRAAVRRAPQYAFEVLADIKRCLPTSVVLELAPGAAWRQSTHVVLLRGSLAADAPTELDGMSGVTSPRASYSHHRTRSVEAGAPAAGSGAAASSSFLRRTSTTGDGEAAWEAALAATAAAPQAPRVMPWLWCPRYHCNCNAAGRMPDDTRWRAGSEGALLLVCLTEAGELPMGVADAEAEAAAARAAAELLASQQAAANSLRSHPLDVLARGSSGMPLPAGGVTVEAVDRITVEPLSARGPADPRPSGLRRLMPWQHLWQQPRSRPVPELSGERSGGESSAPGSSRGGGSQGDLLRLFSGSGGQ
ncbi:Sodium hydrogen exchanger 7 [Chlorella sorokiniana]|uniref:Sodium hydrogen exchanger 7 n=1 Tax=Chlorella sorokiniana TaxID=3076 RepID=A0A2P6TF42_CHLSO|nr:Sodium hydrogen exchanger 7 [Chlorella sorokiniana]|eukprot:PRW32594.1 Sodium hydrogen exchanger 7 [Chlorella sorokiniana]